MHERLYPVPPCKTSVGAKVSGDDDFSHTSHQSCDRLPVSRVVVGRIIALALVASLEVTRDAVATNGCSQSEGLFNLLDFLLKTPDIADQDGAPLNPYDAGSLQTAEIAGYEFTDSANLRSEFLIARRKHDF